jgi:hypothetical protein
MAILYKKQCQIIIVKLSQRVKTKGTEKKEWASQGARTCKNNQNLEKGHTSTCLASKKIQISQF